MHLRAVVAVRRALAALVAALLVTGIAASVALGQDGADAPDRVIEILPVEGLLDPPVAGAVVDVIDDANARGSELVVVQLSSPGTVSADVAALVRAVGDSDVPVAMYVGPAGVAATAAGGGAWLWLAGHVSAIAPDATAGPLTPVVVGQDDGGTRSAPLASGDEAAGPLATTREPLAADALATAGVADLVVPGLEPLLVELDGATVTTAAGATTLRLRRDEVSVRFHTLGLIRRMLHAATTAPFVYLLFTVGLALLAFEIFQPGFGVAGVAGIVMVAIGGFGLTVLPVAGWALALIVVGLGLFTLDVAIAGFGPVTLAAAAAFAAGSWWLYDAAVLALPWWLVAVTTGAAVVFFVLVVTVVLRAQAGPEGLAVDALVGRPGIVRSVLNPEGHVYIDGALWRARWTGPSPRAKVGTAVQVCDVDGPVLLVDALDGQRSS